MRLDQAARSIFLTEFVSAFVLAMRYFFKPKPTQMLWPFEYSLCHGFMPRKRMGPPLRSFAADAHGCIMVRVLGPAGEGRTAS
jgi:NADH-quinone oxidoreductase subunit I